MSGSHNDIVAVDGACRGILFHAIGMLQTCTPNRTQGAMTGVGINTRHGPAACGFTRAATWMSVTVIALVIMLRL